MRYRNKNAKRLSRASVGRKYTNRRRTQRRSFKSYQRYKVGK